MAALRPIVAVALALAASATPAPARAGDGVVRHGGRLRLRRERDRSPPRQRKRGPPDRLTIANGNISGIGGAGIGLDVGDGHVIRNVRVGHNGHEGIRVDGAAARIQGATSHRNGSDGISAGRFAQAIDCEAYDNGGVGIRVGLSATVASATAASNGGAGIVAKEGVEIRDCSVRDNGGRASSSISSFRPAKKGGWSKAARSPAMGRAASTSEVACSSSRTRSSTMRGAD
jgi:hypothetical protein